MKLSYQVIDLPLKHTFTIAHQSRDIQDTLIVKLEDAGFYGLGESTTNPFYGMTIENMTERLEAARAIVERGSWDHPERLWEMTKEIFAENPFAQCALDMAAWDLYTKKQGKKLYEYLGLSPKDIPLTNFTIGIDSLDKMVSKMKEVDWPIYKIKLGTDNDLEIVRELRKHSDAIFRIDANCAWTAEQAIRNSEVLAQLGVEFMEQPLGKDDLEGMKEVFLHSKLPVMADESCIVESDVKKCQGLFHAINVKLVKAGGITPGIRMIHEAKSLGMKTMVGCMTESSVGISAIAHIAPLLDYVDMDGAMLLAKDPAKGVQITPEKVSFPDGPGIGAEMI
ncbi:L-alanine-DL-glutamate epimerase [Algoriphagus faecimaris]|uniref:Dipeptide epimerase n=1 Tax=Algoriphagus faecimaris TaxID=686796 RepID=A0A1G6QTD8_9BACT|nr:dipeptide epimerase [Algoriphagus faecimaris]SDC95699.1 L-alanine-DL-glutamate epimerase [Algoriphagus faecimaris]